MLAKKASDGQVFIEFIPRDARAVPLGCHLTRRTPRHRAAPAWVWWVSRKAGWSFRLRLHSGLRQHGAHPSRMKPRDEWGTRGLRRGRYSIHDGGTVMDGAPGNANIAHDIARPQVVLS